MTTFATSPNQAIAHYPIHLNLPDSPTTLVSDAAEAVRQEYRNSIRWKRLRSLSVSLSTDLPGESVFIVEVGRSIQFDWTWEGAIAFRPSDIAGFQGDIDTTDDFLFGTDGDSAIHSSEWAGEVVEVDETNGRIFVSVSDVNHPPRTGTFFVRPFEFLTFLNAVYSEADFSALRSQLAARLEACRGNIHPAIGSTARGGLHELSRLWQHTWGLLWGPPGTGKTHTIGKQIAACVSDPSERILVVSTTNKATDTAALSIGKAANEVCVDIREGRILRIGKGACFRVFEENGLQEMLRGTETDLLHKLTVLNSKLQRTNVLEERASLRQDIQRLVRSMRDTAFNIFVAPSCRVVVSTAFKALTLVNDGTIRGMLTRGEAPFTTVIIDEAGLISRATAAALSLLASRRVLIVGDAKQLAPISRISRVLPTSQATWLASSSLSHLSSISQVNSAVHLLREQHRMHPDISQVVSHYQYDKSLLDSPAVKSRSFILPPLLQGQPRAVWYVLDEEGDDLPSIRAERGPGNRSWVRPITKGVLAKIFMDAALRQAKGLFLSPFKAQAKDIARFVADEKMDSWSASTIHSQQGTEADFVILDTVNAGSCGWPYDEWKRLVNVGISRAKESMILLASRAEMNEPYMKPLISTLTPLVLTKTGRTFTWVQVPVERPFQIPEAIATNPDFLGSQLARRKILRPVMSSDQQWLCGLNMDGKPRLVRGVAGSGKTVVLAHWLQKTVKKLTLAGQPDARVWAVFANKSLKDLIVETIEGAWKSDCDGSPFPWERVGLFHIIDVLNLLLPEFRLSVSAFDYDAAAAQYLERKPFEKLKARCHAMFIDEAQDMGKNTLKLLAGLVEQSDPADPKSRAVNIFYDNAQNVYRRKKFTWSEIGIDVQGRSTVMKESFRSTKPITEFALNFLYHFRSPETDPDHNELLKRGLVEETSRNGQKWWDVRFNQVDGPKPIYRKFARYEKEFEAIGDQILQWVQKEGVQPKDICIIYHGDWTAKTLEGVCKWLFWDLQQARTNCLVFPGFPRCRAAIDCSRSIYDEGPLGFAVKNGHPAREKRTPITNKTYGESWSQTSAHAKNPSVFCGGKAFANSLLLGCVSERWKNAGIKATVEKSRPRRVENNTVVLCTANSFKGYDAEIVLIAGVEQFVAEKEILPYHLYVAMTRARSLLAVFGWARPDENGKKLVAVIEQCLNNLLVTRKVELSASRMDELSDLLAFIGEEHKRWFEDIFTTRWVEQEPILSSAGELLAEPLFWFKDDERVYACFGKMEPSTYTLQKLEDAGIKVISPGQRV